MTTGNEETESETLSTWGTQDRSEELPSHSEWLEGYRNLSSNFKPFSFGIAGSDWSGGKNPFVSLDQAIINRLKSQAIARLQEVERFIEWYIEEKRKVQYEIDELNLLQAMYDEALGEYHRLSQSDSNSSEVEE